MAVVAGALTEAASNAAQTSSRPASSGAARRGAVTPTSGPSEVDGEPRADQHGQRCAWYISGKRRDGPAGNPHGPEQNLTGQDEEQQDQQDLHRPEPVGGDQQGKQHKSRDARAQPPPRPGRGAVATADPMAVTSPVASGSRGFLQVRSGPGRCPGSSCGRRGNKMTEPP